MVRGKEKRVPLLRRDFGAIALCLELLPGVEMQSECIPVTENGVLCNEEVVVGMT